MRCGLIGAALVVLTVGCASTSGVSKYPENEKLQREVSRVVKSVRHSEGELLFAHLRRLTAYDIFAVDQVVDLFDDPNARLRSNAMWVLGHIREVEDRMDRKIVSTLRAGMKDPNHLVRLEAASALLARNEYGVIPVLIDGLGDRQVRVNLSCAETLRAVTSQNFGYTVDSTPSTKQAAIERWRAWFDGWKEEHAGG